MKKTCVLLIQLGTPDSPKTSDVRRYLSEFLNDPRVIDLPYLARKLLVNGIIVPFRAPKSAKIYQELWEMSGGVSPLITHTENVTQLLQKKMDEQFTVEFAMRYQNPSMDMVLEKIRKVNYDKIIIIPLFPQYASASSGSAIEKAMNIIRKWWVIPEIKIVSQFWDSEGYINSIVERSKAFDPKSYDHVLFSYHGIPERHIKKSDPTKNHCKLDGSCCERNSVAHHTCYRHQCFETTKGIVENLELKDGTFSNSFQSRLLKDPWLKPYTDFELEKFPEEGKKKVAVVTPAFVSDCLETLEEIAMEGKEDFLKAGGTDFKHIPCMNDNDDWVEVMASWIQNWQKTN